MPSARLAAMCTRLQSSNAQTANDVHRWLNKMKARSTHPMRLRPHGPLSGAERSGLHGESRGSKVMRGDVAVIPRAYFSL